MRTAAPAAEHEICSGASSTTTSGLVAAGAAATIDSTGTRRETSAPSSPETTFVIALHLMATRIGAALDGASTTPPVNSMSGSICKEKRPQVSLPVWLLSQAGEGSLRKSRRSNAVTPGAVRYAWLRERALKYGMAGMPPSMQRKWWLMRILATPPWVDMKAIKAVYERAHANGHTVDHIVPLNHPRVCGLHVPWNLRELPAKSNFSRGNAWCEWHGDLFDQPEQLKLF